MVLLRLFGGASIESGEKPITGRSAQRRRIALLALLALARRGLTRDKLIG
jgi:DNA-binding SARP family transcriptional activator